MTLAIRHGLIAILLLVTSSFASAQMQFLPLPNQIAEPDEQALIAPVFGEAIREAEANPNSALAKVDAAIASTTKPTPFRGLLLFVRANILMQLKRVEEAQRSVDESVTLLPRYLGPLGLGAQIYGYSDRPERAANYIQQALLIDPRSARMFSSDQIDSILRRLRNSNDRRTAGRLASALIENGWQEGDRSTKSTITRLAIQHYLDGDNIDAAKRLIPSVVSPEDSYKMLTQKSFDRLWPEIETWAGPKQSKQWSVYLVNVRNRWRASGRIDDGLDYASALADAGDDQTLVEQFLPALNSKLDPKVDYDAVFLAPKVGQALARLGRYDDALALYDKMQAIWPLDSMASALNFSLNRAVTLHWAGRHQESIDAFSASYEAAKRFGSEVNGDALANSKIVEGCALYKLGRKAEAADVALMVYGAPASHQASLYFCMGQPEALKKLYLRDIRDENRRDVIIMALQPDISSWPKGSIKADLRAQERTFKMDADLVKAIERYGRILPYTSGDGAPQNWGR